MEIKSLSAREKEVLHRLVHLEQNQKEIGGALGISEKSVNTYKTAVMKKLGVKNNVDLVKTSIRLGFTTLDGTQPHEQLAND